MAVELFDMPVAPEVPVDLLKRMCVIYHYPSHVHVEEDEVEGKADANEGVAEGAVRGYSKVVQE